MDEFFIWFILKHWLGNYDILENILNEKRWKSWAKSRADWPSCFQGWGTKVKDGKIL